MFYRGIGNLPVSTNPRYGKPNHVGPAPQIKPKHLDQLVVALSPLRRWWAPTTHKGVGSSHKLLEKITSQISTKPSRCRQTPRVINHSFAWWQSSAKDQSRDECTWFFPTTSQLNHNENLRCGVNAQCSKMFKWKSLFCPWAEGEVFIPPPTKYSRYTENSWKFRASGTTAVQIAVLPLRLCQRRTAMSEASETTVRSQRGSFDV